ncbi:hypothetical protein [Nocardioides sp. LHG3406-4]|uniref:hypothetical protein n=1 Tax=Nocardioides sp. LHG3406-4 TaxID=2804575 RepID=UPI003CF0BFC2
MDEAVFELTVDGELGPALRHALQSPAAERCAGTDFRAVASTGSDVADVVDMLNAEGLTIESVRVSEPSTGRRRQAPAGQ